jgi:hypothetical protein
MNLGSNIQPAITAEWARKESNAILSEKLEKQLLKALDAVIYAINNDNESASAHTILHDKVRGILRSRGFKLEDIKGYDQRDPDYVKITW